MEANHGNLERPQDASFYTNFEIPKRSGGQRTISAPHGSLLLLQQKLAEILQDYYEPRHSTQGYVRGRSIVTNVRQHVGRRWILNVDLVDFFPTITYARIYGIFKAKPFDLSDDVAHVLTKLCTHNGALPIGAPTSPVLSNLICRRMDMDLQALASRTGCWYTRYADDITISSDRSTFPRILATTTATGDVAACGSLSALIELHGFEININKTRLQGRGI